MAIKTVTNGRSAEKFRKELVRFLSTHKISLCAFTRVSKTSQPNLQGSLTKKTRFNPTLDTVDNLRRAMEKIEKNPNAKY